MFKFIKIETAVGTEAQLNKLQEEGWRVVGCGPDYVVMTDIRRVFRSKKSYEGDDEINMNMRRYLRENADINREVGDLRKRLSATEDEDSIKHWDSLRQSRDRYQNVAHELFEALCWASGAADFSPGGQASEGWERGPRLAMEAYQEAQRVEHEGNRER